MNSEVQPARITRIHVEDWELNGVDPAYVPDGPENNVEDDPPGESIVLHEPPPKPVSHFSWCTMQECDGNCCVSTARQTQRLQLHNSRTGERQRQAYNKAVANAAVKRRTIVEESATTTLTPAQATLARMLAKVRRTDQL